MTNEQINALAPGLYRLHWNSGGVSFAAIGISSSGKRWVAPTNWIEPALSGHLTEWAGLDRVERLDFDNPAPCEDSVMRMLGSIENRLMELRSPGLETISSYIRDVGEKVDTSGALLVRLSSRFDAVSHSASAYDRRHAARAHVEATGHIQGNLNLIKEEAFIAGAKWREENTPTGKGTPEFEAVSRELKDRLESIDAMLLRLDDKLPPRSQILEDMESGEPTKAQIMDKLQDIQSIGLQSVVDAIANAVEDRAVFKLNQLIEMLQRLNKRADDAAGRILDGMVNMGVQFDKELADSFGELSGQIERVQVGFEGLADRNHGELLGFVEAIHGEITRPGDPVPGRLHDVPAPDDEPLMRSPVLTGQDEAIYNDIVRPTADVELKTLYMPDPVKEVFRQAINQQAAEIKKLRAQKVELDTADHPSRITATQIQLRERIMELEVDNANLRNRLDELSKSMTNWIKIAIGAA